MPIMQTCPGTNDLCYTCNKPGNPLRTCSRCKIARYCSQECQTTDWKEHKQTCIDHQAELAANEDPDAAKRLKVFSKWNDVWRDGILAWGAFSADLANQPPNFLLTHSFFLRIERRAQDTKRSVNAKYQVVSSGMRADAEVLADLQRIPDPEYRESNINGFQRLTPRRNLLRYIVESWPYFGTGGNFVEAAVGEEEAKAFTNSQSAESRVLSAGLKQRWSDQFADRLNAGDTSGHIKVLQDLKQVVSIMSDMALDVD
ncbi:hypothetical protein C8R43DRAFT_958199 [Mycena crocata]|nr:hypothetical protein C8R43DRAFT_958199 [Mycena crocata]